MSSTLPPTIREAMPADTASICALLSAADLPLDGVPEDLSTILVAERVEEGVPVLVGAVALERHGNAALLRSTVVAMRLRGTGLGELLVTQALDRAKRDGVKELILLTTTADQWFPRFGFQRIAREQVPASLRASREFQGACPASAIAMGLKV